MTGSLDLNVRHSHTFSTQDPTQEQIPGADPRRLLALPEDILDVITRRISSGGTPQENAANAIAWGRVAVLPHITTQAPHVECVLDKAKHLDEALVLLWQHGIASQLPLDRVPEMTTAREIRGWMTDPANAALLDAIITINLSHAAPGAKAQSVREDVIELRTLPPEVNRLKVIPPEINALTHLRYLYLEHNQITQIGPRAFAGCPRLLILNLGYNQISLVDHEAFAGCRALHRLYLCNNRITQIDHRTFVDCPNLYRLDSENNQITQIDPRTFAGLLALQFLGFDNNRITQIAPQTFASCPALYFLSLSGNQITRVDFRTPASYPRLHYLSLSNNQITCIDPEVFASCPALVSLHLSNNQITYIDPEVFASCPALAGLYLDNPSLLCTLNIHVNHLPMINRFSRYVCRSPLAAFYQALYEGAIPMSDVAGLVKGLEERNLIYEMVYWEARAAAEQKGRAFDTGGDPQWGENHVCDDKAIFCRALKRAVREKFNRLSAEQKCAVHGAIYRIAREEVFRPLDASDWNYPNWGENHREDNVLWLIDAMRGT